MNSELIDNLDVLAKYYKKTNDQWREKAYRSVIMNIKQFPEEITNINQVLGIKSIGHNITELIKEYLDTGEILKVEQIRHILREDSKENKKDKIIESFLGIWGVGNVKAVSLYNAGMRSINQLKKNQQLLNESQCIGLKYYNELVEPIPRKIITSFKLLLADIMNKKFGADSYKLEIAGSYRRGLQQSGDIDCLIVSGRLVLKKIVGVLKRRDIITETLSMKDEKFMGIAHYPGYNNHFRMDIQFVPEEYYGSSLLYFTGSKSYNIQLRSNAKRKGLILNQRGLHFSNGKRIPLFTEREIVEELGLEYLPPESR